MEWNVNNISSIVKYINNQLYLKRTMTDIEKIDFNVNPRVIHKRLSRLGYKKINNQYIIDNNKTITKVIPKQKSIKNTNSITIDSSKIIELIEMIEPLKEIIHEYNKSKTYVDVVPIELKPRAVIEVKQKLFKVDVKVLDKWEMFVRDHKEYKIQQLISLAIEEFVDKYN